MKNVTIICKCPLLPTPGILPHPLSFTLGLPLLPHSLSQLPSPSFVPLPPALFLPPLSPPPDPGLCLTVLSNVEIGSFRCFIIIIYFFVYILDGGWLLVGSAKKKWTKEARIRGRGKWETDRPTNREKYGRQWTTTHEIEKSPRLLKVRGSAGDRNP